MARVSLILPISDVASLPLAAVREIVSTLKQTGHSVDVVAVRDPRLPEAPTDFGPGWTVLVSEESGLASSAIAGLAAARGDVFVVLDPQRGYATEDVGRVITPILRGDAELAIGSRRGTETSNESPSGLGGWLVAATRRMIGTADPLSGLLAIAPALARESPLTPAGSLFALELLVKTEGRRTDVAVKSPAKGGLSAIGLGDIRQLKRVADYRFGNLSRLIQFCLVGASGMVVDLSCYAAFQWVCRRTWLAEATAPVVGGSAALAVAGALAIAVALTWNFSLNRRLTFSYARRGSFFRQYVTYALSNALGIALSFTLRLILPTRFGFFHRHTLAAAAVGIVAATGISFSMSRWIVFSRRSVARDEARSQAATTLTAF
jgi:dolichol-phosphate mannosyltransferase